MKAGEKAILAGSDMDMESRIYMEQLPTRKEGKVDIKFVDDAVREF
jgi:beta-glucosidase